MVREAGVEPAMSLLDRLSGVQPDTLAKRELLPDVSLCILHRTTKTRDQPNQMLVKVPVQKAYKESSRTVIRTSWALAQQV